MRILQNVSKFVNISKNSLSGCGLAVEKYNFVATDNIQKLSVYDCLR